MTEDNNVGCDKCLYDTEIEVGGEITPDCAAPKSNYWRYNCGFLTINEQIRRLEIYYLNLRYGKALVEKSEEQRTAIVALPPEGL